MVIYSSTISYVGNSLSVGSLLNTPATSSTANTVTFTIPNLVNYGTSSDNVITFQMTAVVANVAANAAGVTLASTARMIYGGTPTSFITTNSFATLTIQEPALSISSEFLFSFYQLQYWY